MERTLKDATLKDVRIIPRMEEYALSTVHRSSVAAVEGVQIKLLGEKCA